MNWTFEHDVMLCREILVIEPFSFRYGSRERGQAWEKIAHNLNQSIYPKFNVDKRAVRDHFLKLERVFKRQIAEEERASGISPESTELDMAMEEIVEKSKEAKDGLDRKNEKKIQLLMQKGRQLRILGKDQWRDGVKLQRGKIWLEQRKDKK